MWEDLGRERKSCSGTGLEPYACKLMIRIAFRLQYILCALCLGFCSRPVLLSGADRD
jgi:hypothetical protein